ncbi:GGDEF domain-containing protein [Oleidesulfovibrio alaskensis]|jgi:EAL domain-containing protein (putative c-di-GMP-specific phosphodiesterase class I)/GGDEF domain-containing protein/CBS domain-containing protein|uniref:GGDEF domain-containing protein n=1 Tax=Oleidesulfovibrio alaskensis TaxID=58180 RepID=UPI0004134E64|nr:GGDEF domain-containing protein [Oleidesulfovibrio alaskensis]
MARQETLPLLTTGRADGDTAPDSAVRPLLKGGVPLHIILLILPEHSLMGKLYGQEMADNIITMAATAMHKAPALKGAKPVLFSPSAGELCAAFPAENAQRGNLADTAYTIRLMVQNSIEPEAVRWTGRSIQINAGCAVCQPAADSVRQARGFMSALAEARQLAQQGMNAGQLHMAGELRSILARKSLRTLYQPIINLSTGETAAWEALTRGPEGTVFESPLILFDMAEELGQLFAIERLCRESAVRGAGTLGPEQLLFLNVHPRTLTDPAFSTGNTRNMLEAAGLSPQNVVLEITERHSIRNFTLFYKTLAHYRGQGYKIAIDDAGTGYSGLSSIAEITPDFIKVDMSLIRGINRDPVRRALMETMISLADKIGSRVIAEGIETREEAMTLAETGAHFGQGFYFGRPCAGRRTITISPEKLRIQPFSTVLHPVGCSVPTGNLALPVTSVTGSTRVSTVRELFEQHHPMTSIAVVDDGRPVGLVMDYHLNRQLSAQYGVALYFKRPVSSVMDHTPLVVDENEPVECTAQRAMARGKLQAYDDVLVTRAGRLTGAVSVQSLLNTLAKVQVELAKGSNPLSGLPGNVALEREMERRLHSGQRFALIYADLDNFKSYNDSYGFKNGDRVILLLARLLSWAVRRHGTDSDFTAHIGGDDFVCAVHADRAERICQAVVRCFKRLVRSCYCEKDLAKGWIRARGRDGVERQYSLVSVSLAVIECHGSVSLQEIGERAAQIKHFAKTLEGNVYVTDRRAPLGSGKATACTCQPA